MNMDWSELAFASKKGVSALGAVFIAAPRRMSVKRFTQIIKQYLPLGNIVLGVAKETYIAGFENQPHFKTLQLTDVQNIIGKINKAGLKQKVYTLSYFQRELNYILQKLIFKKVVLVNGSWQFAFHTRPEYYTLANKRTSYDMVSPFANEQEARGAERILPPDPWWAGEYTKTEMMQIAYEVAKNSFDYTFQTGVSLGRKTKGNKYEYLTATFNKVVPYQGYAMHYGAAREANFSPPNDLNHYDTVHAEVEMVIRAQQEQINLNGTTLFINLLPCPSCARMLTETDIAELIYTQDHSNGYAIRMLQAAGKKVTRLTEVLKWRQPIPNTNT